MGDLSIVNGRLLRPEGLVAETLHVADGRIAADPSPRARVIDAEGCFVLPGIVDLHGDAFERVLMPRPGVHFPPDVALHETDRQLVANGITTAYYGLTVSWEPGLRSLDHARAVRAAIAAARPTLSCQTLLHLRWETFNLDDAQAVLDMLVGEPQPILAFNDHTTKEAERRANPRKLAHWAERSGMSVDAYRETIDRIWARRDAVPAAISAMAQGARAVGATLLAHDEETPAQRRWYRALGAAASEFPLSPETAAEARAHGEHVILGAPNVVRGGSHNGLLDATAAVADGLCSVLASDYYYPAPLLAAFKLARNGVCTLDRAWSLVSENAAAVAGLGDRGRLAAGLRADIILVTTPADRPPEVTATIVGGEVVYRRRP